MKKHKTIIIIVIKISPQQATLGRKVTGTPNPRNFRIFLYPSLAFILPLIIRAIPEILMAPYVTGFDTMGHYVPTTLFWLDGRVDFWGFVATAPLFYSIVVFLVSSGASLITVLKIIPPVLHGFLGLSVYGYAKTSLVWTPRKSMVTALLATIYFVSLRISWDMLRNELALVLFFVALTLINTKSNLNPRKRYLLLSLVMSLVVLSHQLVSALMFSIIGLTIAYNFLRYQRSEISRLLIVSLPAILIFLLTFFFSPKIAEFRIIFGFSQTDGWLSLFGFSSYGSLLANVAGFFIFLFLPILPLVIIGLRRLRDFQMRAWVLLCVVAALIPMVSPSNLRWLMLLTYPFAFFVSEALSRLGHVSWGRFRISSLKVVVVYLLIMVSVLSFSLLLFPPENPAPYFRSNVYNNYVYQIPTSMLQNTVSIADCQATTNALLWLKNNFDENATLLSHRAFYGWSLSVINSNQVILYEYDNPEDTAKILAKQGNSQIYLIWWVNGQGWYGQPTVPSAFLEVYRSGRIAIYMYEPITKGQG